jgi:hypothetical protein
MREVASDNARKAMTMVIVISGTDRLGVLVGVGGSVGVAVGLAESVIEFWVCGVVLTRGEDVGDGVGVGVS